MLKLLIDENIVLLRITELLLTNVFWFRLNKQQRWSAAPAAVDASASESEAEDEPQPAVRRHPSGTARPFARSGARVSMQIFGANSRWAEAADNALLNSATGSTSSSHPPDYEETMHRRTRSLRREPVGATSESMPSSDGQLAPCGGQLVVLPNEGGPLGIHVVPDYSAPAGGSAGEPAGLLVQGVEPGGRVHRDGRIEVRDRIVEINGHPLRDVPFHRAQELFRNALQVTISPIFLFRFFSIVFFLSSTEKVESFFEFTVFKITFGILGELSDSYSNGLIVRRDPLCFWVFVFSAFQLFEFHWAEFQLTEFQ